MLTYKKQIGMTLIELMIVVAIIGILAGIAYPSYQDSVRKSRRADAHTTLFGIQLALEKMRGNCSQYASASATNLGDTAITLSDSCALTGDKDVSVRGDHYKYSVILASGTESSAYTIVADGSASGQSGDTGCTEIKLARDGTQSPAACW